MWNAPWNEQLFPAWGLAVWLLPVAVALAALLSLPSALWTRMRWRPSWGAWVFSALPALMLCVWRANWWGFRFLGANPLLAVGYMLPLVLILLVPQALAYPLSREQPLKRVWMTALLASGSSVLWLVMAALSGATTD